MTEQIYKKPSGNLKIFLIILLGLLGLGSEMAFVVWVASTLNHYPPF